MAVNEYKVITVSAGPTTLQTILNEELEEGFEFVDMSEANGFVWVVLAKS